MASRDADCSARCNTAATTIIGRGTEAPSVPAADSETRPARRVQGPGARDQRTFSGPSRRPTVVRAGAPRPLRRRFSMTTAAPGPIPATPAVHVLVSRLAPALLDAEKLDVYRVALAAQVQAATLMPDASPTVQLPKRCSIRLSGDMCGDFATSRSPITTSALPRTIGATRRAMSLPAY